MRTQHVGNYLMDTDVFLDHLHKKDGLTLEEGAFEDLKMFGINISPYVHVINYQSDYFRAMFYIKFTKLLQDSGLLQHNTVISSHNDLVDKAQLLSWIYFIQDSLL